MKLPGLKKQYLGWFLGALSFISLAQAGVPLWVFRPDASFPPQTFVSPTGMAIVKYSVFNNTSKTRNLVIMPEPGVRQVGPCLVGPRGYASSVCLLTLIIEGNKLPFGGLVGGPALCQASTNGSPNPNQCYQPSGADSLLVTRVQGAPILRVSTANLALSVTGLILNSLPSGQPRVITISNSGEASATGLQISFPTFPTGTSAVTTCTGTLVPGGACTITVTPGATATSGANNQACTTGVAPLPGVITVSSSNGANQVSTNVTILGYGCIYQGGFVYDMTETADRTLSIGGKVVTLTDQAPPFPNGINWSSNGDTGHGSGGTDFIDVSFDVLPGIDEISTLSTPSPTFSTFQTFFSTNYTNLNPFTPASFMACNGNSDGQCNSNNILTYYNRLITNFDAFAVPPYTATPGPTPLAFYAAGLCKATINGFSDWYLPAICEMGPISSVSSGCSVGMQNIVDDLPNLLGDPVSISPGTSCIFGANCLVGFYWSSTEYSPNAEELAWDQFFSSGGDSMQDVNFKATLLGVRCSRALTQ